MYETILELNGVATRIIVAPYADRVFVTITQLPTFGTLISVFPEEYPDGMRFFNSRTLLGRRDDEEAELLGALARRVAEDIFIDVGLPSLFAIGLRFKRHTEESSASSSTSSASTATTPGTGTGGKEDSKEETSQTILMDENQILVKVIMDWFKANAPWRKTSASTASTSSSSAPSSSSSSSSSSSNAAANSSSSNKAPSAGGGEATASVTAGSVGGGGGGGEGGLSAEEIKERQSMMSQFKSTIRAGKAAVKTEPATEPLEE